MSQIIYTVQLGDTLYGIARLFGSTITEIVDVNTITNQNLIYPSLDPFMLIPLVLGLLF